MRGANRRQRRRRWRCVGCGGVVHRRPSADAAGHLEDRHVHQHDDAADHAADGQHQDRLGSAARAAPGRARAARRASSATRSSAACSWPVASETRSTRQVSVQQPGLVRHDCASAACRSRPRRARSSALAVADRDELAACPAPSAPGCRSGSASHRCAPAATGRSCARGRIHGSRTVCCSSQAESWRRALAPHHPGAAPSASASAIQIGPCIAVQRLAELDEQARQRGDVLHGVVQHQRETRHRRRRAGTARQEGHAHQQRGVDAGRHQAAAQRLQPRGVAAESRYGCRRGRR